MSSISKDGIIVEGARADMRRCRACVSACSLNECSSSGVKTFEGRPKIAGANPSTSFNELRNREPENPLQKNVSLAKIVLPTISGSFV